MNYYANFHHYALSSNWTICTQQFSIILLACYALSLQVHSHCLESKPSQQGCGSLSVQSSNLIFILGSTGIEIYFDNEPKPA